MYLQSPEWKTTRRHKLEQAGYRCELCYSEMRIQVHHKTYDRARNERLSDLIVLCDECHARHHDVVESDDVNNGKVRSRLYRGDCKIARTVATHDRGRGLFVGYTIREMYKRVHGGGKWYRTIDKTALAYGSLITTDADGNTRDRVRRMATDVVGWSIPDYFEDNEQVDHSQLRPCQFVAYDDYENGDLYRRITEFRSFGAKVDSVPSAATAR